MQSPNISEGLSDSSQSGPRRRSYVANPPSEFCLARRNSTASSILSGESRSTPRRNSGRSWARRMAVRASAVQSDTGHRCDPSEKHQPPRIESRHCRVHRRNPATNRSEKPSLHTAMAIASAFDSRTSGPAKEIPSSENARTIPGCGRARKHLVAAKTDQWWWRP